MNKVIIQYYGNTICYHHCTTFLYVRMSLDVKVYINISYHLSKRNIKYIAN